MSSQDKMACLSYIQNLSTASPYKKIPIFSKIGKQSICVLI